MDRPFGAASPFSSRVRLIVTNKDVPSIQFVEIEKVTMADAMKQPDSPLAATSGEAPLMPESRKVEGD
jgi:hypothetical protein